MSEWWQIQLWLNSAWSDFGAPWPDMGGAVQRYNRAVKANTGDKYRLLHIRLTRPLFDD